MEGSKAKTGFNALKNGFKGVCRPHNTDRHGRQSSMIPHRQIKTLEAKKKNPPNLIPSKFCFFLVFLCYKSSGKGHHTRTKPWEGVYLRQLTQITNVKYHRQDSKERPHEKREAKMEEWRAM